MERVKFLYNTAFSISNFINADDHARVSFHSGAAINLAIYFLVCSISAYDVIELELVCLAARYSNGFGIIEFESCTF